MRRWQLSERQAKPSDWFQQWVRCTKVTWRWSSVPGRCLMWLAHAVRALASTHHAVLLANHGPVAAGTSLANAQYATEELEETAKLFLMLQNQALRLLTPEQIADLRHRFNLS